MNRLRQIHLYLGCVFAPLLAFFAISGLWQNYSLPYAWSGTATHPRVQHMLALLSTLHTGRGLKLGDPSTLSSPVMRWFVVAMALSLLLTMALGIGMAFRFGRARVATVCLIAGVVVPLGLSALTIAKS